MRKLTEAEALARLQRSKAAFQTHVKLNFEHKALDCRACPTPGVPSLEATRSTEDANDVLPTLRRRIHAGA